MDEYQIEIRDLRRTLGRLKADPTTRPELIEEYEAELRILVSLYEAALAMLARGSGDPELREALGEQGFDGWTLPNVYSWVYDRTMEAEPDGRDLANVIGHTDYAGPLLEAAGGKA